MIALLCVLAACRRAEEPRAFAIPGDPGPRIQVEVLNASGKLGLARAGTRTLRRAGIDVVSYGNAPAELGTLDSTRIFVRRGSIAVGQRVRSILKVGSVRLQRDSTLLLAASVLLGSDFAPRLDFHP